MQIVDMLNNDALGHKAISFLDGNTIYNQFLWPRKIYTKWPLDILVLLVYLSVLS
jgi:hypothetical protein